MKLLEFDIAQPVDHDFGLPPEVFGSSAAHPPVHVPVLDNDQGYPRIINVHSSDEGSDIGITVEDVLKTISTDLRVSSSQREWASLNEDRHREVEESFENWARTDEDRSGGLHKVDFLCERNRSQVFPKCQPYKDEELSVAFTLCSRVSHLIFCSLLIIHSIIFTGKVQVLPAHLVILACP